MATIFRQNLCGSALHSEAARRVLVPKPEGRKKLIIVLCLSLSSSYRIKDEGRGFTEDSDQRNRPGAPQQRTRFKMSVKRCPTRTGPKAPPPGLSSSADRETLNTSSFWWLSPCFWGKCEKSYKIKRQRTQHAGIDDAEEVQETFQSRGKQ